METTSKNGVKFVQLDDANVEKHPYLMQVVAELERRNLGGVTMGHTIDIIWSETNKQALWSSTAILDDRKLTREGLEPDQVEEELSKMLTTNDGKITRSASAHFWDSFTPTARTKHTEKIMNTKLFKELIMKGKLIKELTDLARELEPGDHIELHCFRGQQPTIDVLPASPRGTGYSLTDQSVTLALGRNTDESLILLDKVSPMFWDALRRLSEGESAEVFAEICWILETSTSSD